MERGTPVTDWWTDIPTVTGWSPERLGYPTQKPLALLNRIIKASSNPDDLIVDPFCGCGTSIVAAQQLNRRWAGIDTSPLAVEVVRQRFEKIGARINVERIPTTLSEPTPIRSQR